MRFTHYKSKGFTLVEMIVSLGIFSVVAVVALGALVKIMTANRKAQSIQAAFTNINFALEAMSREIRVGTTYRCSNTTESYIASSLIPKTCNINNGNTSVLAFKSAFKSTDGSCNLAYAYRFILDGSKFRLQKAEQANCFSATASGDSLTNASYRDVISSSGIVLQDYRLGVTDGVYPRVFIRLIGYAGDREGERTYFDIQTSVSQRVAQLSN